MYTVLIAEDEVLVRMGLSVSVQWEKMDMCVVGETSDGKQAYDAFRAQKPDILLTDLSMPDMDGITLIKKIRETNEKCAVIVITCMDRFDLLHEAMELGVVAYLVKATMNVSDIESALKKAKESLGQPKARGAGLESLKRQTPAFEAYLFDGTLTCRELLARGRESGFDVLPEYYMLCAVAHSERDISWQLKKTMRNMLGELLKNQHTVQILQKDEVIVILFTRTPKVHEMARNIDAYCRYMRESFGIRMALAAGVEGIALQELPARAAAMTALCARAGDVPPLKWLDALGRLVDAQIQAEFRHLREMLLRTDDYAFALRAVNRVDELERCFERADADLLSGAAALAQMIWTRAGMSGEQIAALQRGLSEARTPGDALRYISEYAAERLPRYRAEICTVIAYVAAHIGEDLSLKQSAALIAMHPQYLSNLFKKEVGVSYSDFICTEQLALAKKKLRDKTQSVREISEVCGFSDLAYFCRKFKQRTGKTPGEWRRDNE